MYAHQVIEDITKKIDIDLDKNTIKDIKCSIKFDIGNANDLMKLFNKTIIKQNCVHNDEICPSCFSTQNFEHLKSPFRKIMLSYFYTCSNCPSIHKECVYIESDTVDLKLSDGNIAKRYVVAIEVYPFDIKNNTFYVAGYNAVIDTEYGFREFYETENTKNILKQNNVKFDGGIDNFINNQKKSVSQSLVISMLFMKLINCKNISTEKNYPVDALNKKRIKQGKQPLFTYHTLVVNPMGEKKRSDNEHEPTGIKQRLHFCRGHFKEYTETNKLFGKHTGLYWWQPIVRGNKELGLVHKDYEVRASVNA